MQKLKIILIFLLISGILSASPYELILKKEILLIGIGGSLFVVDKVIDKDGSVSEEEIDKLNKNDINKFDRSAADNYSENYDDISTVLVLGTSLSPVLLMLDKELQNDYLIITTMYFETMLLSLYTTELTKSLVDRERPYLYNNKSSLKTKLDDNSARNSFFSGHTTMTFASSIFAAKVYSDYNQDSKYKKYVWASSLAVATTVGVLRYESGEHFATDIIVGAIVGSLYGYFIPEIHKRKEKKIVVLTNIVDDKYEIVLNYKF